MRDIAGEEVAPSTVTTGSTYDKVTERLRRDKTKRKRNENENDIPCCDWSSKNQLSCRPITAGYIVFVFVSFSFRLRFVADLLSLCHTETDPHIPRLFPRTHPDNLQRAVRIVSGPVTNSQTKINKQIMVSANRESLRLPKQYSCTLCEITVDQPCVVIQRVRGPGRRGKHVTTRAFPSFKIYSAPPKT